jgi:hypothetical protein
VEQEKVFVERVERWGKGRIKKCLNPGLGPEPRRRGGPLPAPLMEREDGIIRVDIRFSTL